MNPIRADVLIIGAGIQGLWIANKLKKLGFSVLLITDKDIGNGQTLNSQVYKHKGHFYNNVKIAQHLQEVEPDWDKFIRENNLQPAQQNSFLAFESQHTQKWLKIWDQAKLEYTPIQQHEIPQFFQQGSLRKGNFYNTGETCLNGKELIEKLVQPVKEHIFQGKITGFRLHDKSVNEIEAVINGRLYYIVAKRIVLTAGRGNQTLLNQITKDNHVLFEQTKNTQQLRRCQVLVIKGKKLPPTTILCPGYKLFIGCRQVNEESVWLVTYGVDDPIKLDSESAIPIDLHRLHNCIQQLKNVIPQIFELDLDWGLYPAVKAESQALGAGHRPNEDFVGNCGLENVLTVYPTKLSLAPRAGRKVINQIKKSLGQDRVLFNPHEFNLPRKEVAIADERWQSLDFVKWQDFENAIFTTAVA